MIEDCGSILTPPVNHCSVLGQDRHFPVRLQWSLHAYECPSDGQRGNGTTPLSVCLRAVVASSVAYHCQSRGSSSCSERGDAVLLRDGPGIETRRMSESPQVSHRLTPTIESCLSLVARVLDGSRVRGER
ncbi:hypothetical protein FQA47_002820 [Oryzias melastigma]|uniref:Uncharacterized protein n=1 Tax=Oryzias melastigma TaxID=30732 RepID=A0A834C1S1_ORYME|nr:hypothetical protein FQA47_002820 [Oryzias melastigma]